MPPELKARVQAAADANNRTLHAELLAALAAAYPEPTFDPEAAAREYRDLASVLAFAAATDEERAKAVERLNELDRLYKQATGEDI